jgi:glycosyltransferase involved in cell wall biosynthesis
MRIHFIEIDLQKPVKAVYLDDRYDKLRVLVLWDYLPLGIVDFGLPSGSNILSADQLMEKILKSIGSQIWGQAVSGELAIVDNRLNEESPPVSVVVCTRDRPQSLSRCLASLKELEYSDYEVVVVDNRSKDQLVHEIVREFGFKYCREDNPGLDWARNCGIRESKYDIVAFIDDDAMASPGWLSGLARGFNDPSIMCITGLVLPAELETKAQLEFEMYGGMSKGFRPFTIRGDKLKGDEAYWASSWGVGTNMAFRRSLFDAIGVFDEALDVGTPTSGGGDIELFYRTISSGFALRYEPSGYVRHVHRRDKAALKRQIYNNGRSFLAYLITIANKTSRQRFSIAWFAVYGWLWKWLVKRILMSVFKLDLLMLDFALIELSGALTGVTAYRRSQRLKSQLKGIE